MNPAFPSPPTPPEQTGLVLQRGAGMATLPPGNSPALSEIINRSLVHLRTSQSLATRHREPGEECDFEIAPRVMMRMCWIPPGEFLMGSPEDELGHFDETLHLVTITRGFWLGKYEVTQEQWKAVMGSNPSCFKGADLPVECVSWNDIAAPGGFLEKINRFEAEGRKFSLPTESQWEYACRAGTTTALNNGKNLTAADACKNLEEVAWYWYGENSGGKTHPGGLKMANAWGLYDMHGNLSEWCSDWHEDYPTGPVADPLGPDLGSGRVIRGGSWGLAADACVAAFRAGRYPTITSHFIGLRLAQSSGPSHSQ